MDLLPLPFSPASIPEMKKGVSYSQAESTVQGAWSGRRSGEHRGATEQPVATPSSPQPGHRKVRQTVLDQATVDGDPGRTRATSQGPKLAREGTRAPRGNSAFISLQKQMYRLAPLGLEILLKKTLCCLAAHRAKPWK